MSGVGGVGDSQFGGDSLISSIIGATLVTLCCTAAWTHMHASVHKRARARAHVTRRCISVRDTFRCVCSECCSARSFLSSAFSLALPVCASMPSGRAGSSRGSIWMTILPSISHACTTMCVIPSEANVGEECRSPSAAVWSTSLRAEGVAHGLHRSHCSPRERCVWCLRPYLLLTLAAKVNATARDANLAEATPTMQQL